MTLQYESASLTRFNQIGKESFLNKAMNGLIQLNSIVLPMTPVFLLILSFASAEVACFSDVEKHWDIHAADIGRFLSCETNQTEIEVN